MNRFNRAALILGLETGQITSPIVTQLNRLIPAKKTLKTTLKTDNKAVSTNQDMMDYEDEEPQFIILDIDYDAMDVEDTPKRGQKRRQGDDVEKQEKLKKPRFSSQSLVHGY